MTTVLITGATGMLGKAIFTQLKKNGAYQIFTTGRKALAQSTNHNIVTDLNDVENLLAICNPQVVINCAAYVDIKYCEDFKSAADILHQHTVKTIVNYPSVNKFYQISTDSVFDGTRGDYKETDDVNPLNYYAKSKLNGEKEAMMLSGKSYVLRTNIFGFNSSGSQSLFEWAYSNFKKGIAVKGFKNVYFNPLYVGDLSVMISQLIEKDPLPGIYNFGSKPFISKFDFLQRIASAFNFDARLLNATELSGDVNGAIRPLNTTLNTSKLAAVGISIPSIEQCINNLFKDFYNVSTI